MGLLILENLKLEQMRAAERARFQRWFVRTGLGWAYVDRQGRPRSVSDDEYAAWQVAAFAHIEDMLGSVPVKAAWSVAALLIILIGGTWMMAALGIDGTARHIALAVATVIVEGGLIGIDLFDYWKGWERLRDRIEVAVTGRAVLAVDPESARIPRNWAYLAQYFIAGPLVLLYFYSHFDRGMLDWFRAEYVFGVALLAWALHFAAQRHDRRAQERMGRR